MRRKYSFDNFTDIIPLIIAIVIAIVVWVVLDLDDGMLFNMIACVTAGFFVGIFLDW